MATATAADSDMELVELVRREHAVLVGAIGLGQDRTTRR
jgi:hypothetical protein